MSLRPIVTCEHAGNIIPRPYKKYFAGSEGLLESHRGYDIGALALAKILARAFRCPLHFSAVSRLLVDCNRSRENRHVFSDISRRFDDKTRGEIIARYYDPYRAKVEDDIAAAIAVGDTVLHFSVHSFTPVLDGVARNADIGLLYDPSRAMEREFCRRLAPMLGREMAGLRIRMNYPYRGSSDGFTAHLRKTFPEKRYLGIEIEMNQEHLTGRMKKSSALSAR